MISEICKCSMNNMLCVARQFTFVPTFASTCLTTPAKSTSRTPPPLPAPSQPYPHNNQTLHSTSNPTARYPIVAGLLHQQSLCSRERFGGTRSYQRRSRRVEAAYRGQNYHYYPTGGGGIWVRRRRDETIVSHELE